MPFKKPSILESDWINFMRVHRNKYPEYDHWSRKDYYPFASKLYCRWKNLIKCRDLNKPQRIKSMERFFS